MIDGFVTTVVNALISQGGGWLIAVLLGIVVYIMDRRAIEAKAKHDAAIAQQYEKRLEEFRELLEVIGTSTQSIQSMQVSVGASGEAINQLTQAFAKLLREFEGQQAVWGDRSANVVKLLEDIQRRVETLQKGRAA